MKGIHPTFLLSSPSHRSPLSFHNHRLFSIHPSKDIMNGKAIIIKGPTPDAKSYFTGLPGTLDELLQKATKLFPVPPNHTAHLLLSNDAILMPDVLPFLNEREVLTFKWTANTPRSSLRQPSRTTEELLQQVNSSGSSSSGSYDRIARGVRWDASVLSKDEKSGHSNKSTDNISSNIGSARQYRYSATARAEHSRRVLHEQEQQRKKAATGASEAQDSSNDDPFKLYMKSKKEADTSPQTAQHDHSETNATNLEQTRKEASATSPPFSGNNRQHSDEEQINSSPIASPTRNIRSAQKSNKEWMVPLGSDKSEEGTPKPEQPIVQSDTVKEDEIKTSTATQNKENEQPQSKEGSSQNDYTPKADLGKTLPLQKRSRIHDSYQRMVSIVDALRGHPSNRFFRQSIEYDETYIQFVHFLRQHNRPILDFHILGKKLNEQRYGEENVYAAFASDLTEMWCNIRAFFGPGSPQGQCADFLERFSRIIMVEWKREGGKVDGKGRISPPSKDAQPSSDGNTKAEAMARAAKMLHNMTYGNATKSHPQMPNLKRKASDSKSVEMSNKSRFNSTNTRPTFTVQEKKEISPKRHIPSSVPLQKGAGSGKAHESVYNPNTQAFLASIFPKGSHAQSALANKETVPKFVQQNTPEQRVSQTVASKSPTTNSKDDSIRKSPNSMVSAASAVLSPAALKRTEPPSSIEEMQERPAKKVNIGNSSPISLQNLPILTVSDEDPAVVVPPEVIQSSPIRLSASAKRISSPSKDEESAIEQALTTVDQPKTKETEKRTPPSSAKKSVKERTPLRISPRHNKVEAIKNSEPRRNSRQSTPTTLKAVNSSSQSPSRSSPDKTPQKQVQIGSKRMATRSTPTTSITTRGSTRQRRVTATN